MGNNFQTPCHHLRSLRTLSTLRFHTTISYKHFGCATACRSSARLRRWFRVLGVCCHLEGTSSSSRKFGNVGRTCWLRRCCWCSRRRSCWRHPRYSKKALSTLAWSILQTSFPTRLGVFVMLRSEAISILDVLAQVMYSKWLKRWLLGTAKVKSTQLRLQRRPNTSLHVLLLFHVDIPQKYPTLILGDN